jgi:alginate O-acetyltransferase complex protein AlgI
MSVSQIDFWLFTALMLVGYNLVRSSARWRYPYLFLGSAVFYYALGGVAVVLLGFFTLVVYLLGLAIGASTAVARRHWLLVLGISIVVSLLFFFKYASFFSQAIRQVFGPGGDIEHGSAAIFLLPLGISYYTLQAIGYLVDVHRGNCRPLMRFCDLGFYLAFFPRVVAGPILRTVDFFPQMESDRKLTAHELNLASFMIFKGLVKKVVIADSLGPLFVDRIFANPTAHSSLENTFAALGYSIQLYADFSGYMDIMTGVALLFGFSLPPNFLSPMKAVNFGDYYRRWHHTLHLWLKEYLYKPLGGSKSGPTRAYVNITIVFLISGLWHGPAWTFVVFGALNAIGMIGYRVWRSRLGSEGLSSAAMPFAGIVATFIFATYTRVWIRAESVEQAFEMTRKILSVESFWGLGRFMMGNQVFVFILILTMILVFIPERWKERFQEGFMGAPIAARAAAIALVLWWVGANDSGVMQPFIYSRF